MDILKKPIVTEKMTGLGEKLNRYGFIVDKRANKIEIKKAVEEMYDVRVDAVNTINYGGKAKSRYTKTGIISRVKHLLLRRLLLLWPTVTI
jgi:large subunit ribosomal protein L23